MLIVEDKVVQNRLRASKWNRENRPRRRIIERRMRAKRPEQYLLKCSRFNAKKRGLENTLQVSDITVPDRCPVLGVPLVFDTRYAPSLDRIDNTKGYVPGNIQVISRKANAMKLDASQEELELFAKWVLNLE